MSSTGLRYSAGSHDQVFKDPVKAIREIAWVTLNFQVPLASETTQALCYDASRLIYYARCAVYYH